MFVTGEHYQGGLFVSGSGSPGSGLAKNNTTAMDWSCLTDLGTLQGITFQNGFPPNSPSICGALIESLEDS